MTKQYMGDGEWKLWLNNGGWIVLNEEDLKSIQDLDEFNGAKIDKLNDVLYEMEEKISDAQENILEISDNIEGIIDGKEFDNDAFSDEMERLRAVLA